MANTPSEAPWEPAATLDIDIFVVLQAAEGTTLLSVAPLYDYLKIHGGTVQDEHVVIGGWPVQFLPPSNDLENEAIAEARPTTIEGVETRVMVPEHLVAIALNTGRTKDHIRILQFVEQDAVDRNRLQRVLERHGMVSKWRAFERRFMEGTRG